MAHLLTDCTNLLKTAWDEVKVQRSTNAKNKIKCLISDIGHNLGEDYEDAPEYIALTNILEQKISPYNSFFGWISCQQYYKSMLLLLNSDYISCDVLDIGNAETYFRQAIPLYCRLSGETPPTLKSINPAG